MLSRRRFVLGVAAAALPLQAARANVPTPYDWDASPPTSSREAFVAWMVKNRGEDANFLGQRYDRYLKLAAGKDLWEAPTTRAYLMTPREEFVTHDNLARAYEGHFLNIGFGVTITGPHSVCRMTNTLEIKRSDKVLEIGTGSGYQSAVLSNLTPNVFSIEIIAPLAQRTRALYDSLIARGYSEYAAITTKNADGYYGWAEQAPFDKIIVTCGIDHVPPPLLQQMKPDGIMVIPVGPPGAQHVLKVIKKTNADGTITAVRSDIYNGQIQPFVPFTGGHQGVGAL
jgi:protein-L-isoaspartate(D-aspartate) O-methyltransferase